MIAFRVLLLVFVFTVTFITTFAQRREAAPFRPEFSLRSTPLSVLEVDGNFGVGLGYQWAERWALAIDPAYVFLDTYDWETENNRSRYTGIKLRADVRYFFDKNRKGRYNTFIAPEFHYKNRNARRWAEFGINCLGGQCDYFQTALYTEKKKEIGLALKIGTILPLSTSLDLEIYAGAGLKQKRYREHDLPVGGSFTSQPRPDVFRFSDDDEDNFRPMLPAGLKLVFRL